MMRNLSNSTKDRSETQWSCDILNGLAWSQTSEDHGEGAQNLIGPISVRTSYRGPSFSWACVNGPVRFGTVRRNRLEGDENYSAEVLDVDCSPTGFNPLGDFSAGSL